MDRDDESSVSPYEIKVFLHAAWDAVDDEGVHDSMIYGMVMQWRSESIQTESFWSCMSGVRRLSL